MPIGKSADVKERERLLIASFGGSSAVLPVHVISIREFAGNWEYLLDDAIFTGPPHPAWSGAALINRDGKLVGVGSLIVGNTTGRIDNTPGNMFVPIDKLRARACRSDCRRPPLRRSAAVARYYHRRAARPAGCGPGDAGRAC